jgi:hypothetical protein
VTGERVMVQFVLAFLGTFTTVAVFFLAVGVVIGLWIGAAWAQKRAERKRAGLGSWDTSGWLAESGTTFEPGVARVGER